MSATHVGRTAPADASAARLWLRRFLALDAAVTGANALAYLAASGPLRDLLGVDRAMLVCVGAFLLVYAAGVGFLASRRHPPVLAVRCVVEANVAWAVLSVAALALWLSPSTTGTVWIPLQATVVAGFAALQYGALRAATARG
ncbi:hypothetical protein ACWC5C_31750 [Streptomyces sp. NPDC001700]